MHVGMAVALGAIQAGAAGKHQVGDLQQQRILALQQLLRRILECGELIHAIVDDQARVQFLQQRQRHRRVEPRNMVCVIATNWRSSFFR